MKYVNLYKGDKYIVSIAKDEESEATELDLVVEKYFKRFKMENEDKYYVLN